jgi:glycerol-3-phosphate acyltransferase PlsY
MVPSDWLPPTLALSGYVLGSVPFGVVVAKAFRTADPRMAGSRNIGFTNVLRVAGKKAGLLTLLGDMGKGWVMGWVAAASNVPEGWLLVIAASPVIGHVYSVFLSFRGGKGVATAMGAISGIAPVIGAVMLVIWTVTVAAWRYSSAAAIAAFAAFPVLSAGFGMGWKFEIFALLISTFILLRHRGNMVRLWKGEEPRLGQSEGI